MPNRYYIGNPRTILTPDANESVFVVDSGYSLFERKVDMTWVSSLKAKKE